VLTLRSSPTSPFVRKVRIAASVLGLEREIAIEPADTMNASDTVRQQNPLGKIPALVLEDGTVLFDSRVILDYLDHRAGGGRIVPSDAGARFAALRLQALADEPTASALFLYPTKALSRDQEHSLRELVSEGARELSQYRGSPQMCQLPTLVACLAHRHLTRGDVGAIIRVSSPGSTASPRACQPSPRPRRRHSEKFWLVTRGSLARALRGSRRRTRARCRLLPGIAGASRRRLDPRPDANESPGRDVRGSFRLRVIARQNRTFAPARKMLVVKDTLPPGASAQLSPQLKVPRST